MTTSLPPRAIELPDYVLDRREAVPALIGDPKDFLFIGGLAGTSRDTASLLNDGPTHFSMAGTMGAAAMMGLGLALAKPDRTIIVLTGDAELMMNIGSLATIAVRDPKNLRIVCVDNGHFGETGYQRSHTGFGVDLEKIAIGSGIRTTTTITHTQEIPVGRRMLRETDGTAFILMRVRPTPPPAVKRLLDPPAQRLRFRQALLAQG